MAALVSLAVLGGASSTALAVDKRVHHACKRDYKRLCPRYRLNSPQLRACMEANASDISSDCIAALIEYGVVDDRSRSSDTPH